MRKREVESEKARYIEGKRDREREKLKRVGKGGREIN